MSQTIAEAAPQPSHVVCLEPGHYSLLRVAPVNALGAAPWSPPVLVRKRCLRRDLLIKNGQAGEAIESGSPPPLPGGMVHSAPRLCLRRSVRVETSRVVMHHLEVPHHT